MPRGTVGPWRLRCSAWAVRSTRPSRGPAGSPLRVLDQKAMEFAAQDAELKAALFRFVDVTPACRSLDDLARHLSGYLDELDDRPPPIEAAMKMSSTKAGRTALGAAAAAGVKHMAHRFIVGESPRNALRTIRELWDGGAAVSLDLLGEATVTQAEADRYAEPLPRSARHPGRGGARLARAAGAGGRLARAAPAREPVGEGLGAQPAAAAGGPRGRPRRRRPADAPAARASQGAGRAPAHRHGVGGHPGGHHGARDRAARRSPSSTTARRPES